MPDLPRPFLDRLTWGPLPWLLLVLLCAGLFLPGIASLPPMDRDEARFVQATRQMVESGDYLAIRFQEEARNKKPAGIYWLQAAFVGMTGDAAAPVIWPFRLASTAGATLAVLLTFGLAKRLFERRTAFVGAVLLASTLMLVVEAHLAKTDAVLLATAAAAQGALGVLYVHRRAAERLGVAAPVEGWGLPLTFWIAEGISVLIKGPVVPLVGVLTILALVVADRRVRWLGALRAKVGLPVMLAIFLPWLIAIEISSHGAFLAEALGHDMLDKVGGGQESHGQPPGYYALAIFVTFWPASFLLLPGLAQGWRERADPAIRFLAAWVVPAWLLFELVHTKLPHYTLPLYPALALLAARGLLAGADRLLAPAKAPGLPARRRWMPTVGVAVWSLVAGLLAIALIALPIILSLVPPGAAILDALFLAGAVVLGVRHLRRGGVIEGGAHVLALIVATALAVLPATLGATLPRLDPVWLSRSVADAHPPMPLVSVGYTEPSLVFLLGTGIHLIADEGAADILVTAGGGSALVDGAHLARFQELMAARGFALVALAQFHGFDYSIGHWKDLTLYSAVRR